MAVYTNQTDYDQNKDKDPNLKVYDPNTTKLQSGDVYLGGSGATGSPSDDLLKSLGVDRIYGSDRYGTASAYSNYLNKTNASNQAGLQITPQVSALQKSLASSNSGYDAQIDKLRQALAGNIAQAQEDMKQARVDSLDSTAQQRRLWDNNRERTNVAMNTRGLLNSGINDNQQGQIDQNESGAIQGVQAKLASTIKQIQNRIAQMQSQEGMSEASINAQKNAAEQSINQQIEALKGQQPALENKIYNELVATQKADDYQKFLNEQNYNLKLADLLGTYNGQDTLAKLQADRDYSLQQAQLARALSGGGSSGTSITAQKYYDSQNAQQATAQALAELQNAVSSGKTRAEIQNEIQMAMPGLISAGVNTTTISNWLDGIQTLDEQQAAANKKAWDESSSWYKLTHGTALGGLFSN